MQRFSRIANHLFIHTYHFFFRCEIVEPTQQNPINRIRVELSVASVVSKVVIAVSALNMLIFGSVLIGTTVPDNYVKSNRERTSTLFGRSQGPFYLVPRSKNSIKLHSKPKVDQFYFFAVCVEEGTVYYNFVFCSSLFFGVVSTVWLSSAFKSREPVPLSEINSVHFGVEAHLK